MSPTKLAGLLAGAALAFGFVTTAQSAPSAYSRTGVEVTTSVEAPVVKAVTRAGVAHRSARRTARRTTRRHY